MTRRSPAASAGMQGEVRVTLYDELRGRSDGDRLADHLQGPIRDAAAVRLEHVGDLFPSFTDHSIRHSDGVISILDWLIPADVRVQLNSWELYFLLAASLLHDIGMVEACPGSPSGPEWDEFVAAWSRKRSGPAEGGSLDGRDMLDARRAFVRQKHHERSEEYIRRSGKELHLDLSETDGEPAIVGRLASGHRLRDLSNRALFGVVAFGRANQLVRRDLLAAYLRLADELDTTAFRTPWAEFDVVDLSDPTAATEWAKHRSISGCRNDNGLLRLSGECDDADVYRRLLRLEQEVRSKLRELRGWIPAPYATSDGFYSAQPIPYYDIALDVEHHGYYPIDLHITLDHARIIRLLFGDRLYASPWTWMRELLQNAVDACTEAAATDPTFTPEISIGVAEDGLAVEVQDNGAGMDIDIVRDYVCKVGASYYRDLQPSGRRRYIGEYGIGLLSCFMMAQSIEIETLRRGSAPLMILLTGLDDPVTVLPSHRQPQGTTVRLRFSNEHAMPNDIAMLVSGYARELEIPVSVVERDGQRVIVDSRGLRPDPGSLRPVTKWGRMRWSGRQDHPGAELRRRLDLNFATVSHGGLQVGVTMVRGAGLRSTLSQDGFVVCGLNPWHGLPSGEFEIHANLTGESRQPLAVDRNRFVQQPAGSLDRQLLQATFEAIELIYERYKLLGRGWWDFHLRSESLQGDELSRSDAICQSFSADARICVFGPRGYETVTSAQLLEWQRRYWCFEREHSWVAALASPMPPDCVIASIPEDRHHFYSRQLPEWVASLLSIEQADDWLNRSSELGLTVSSLSLDGNEFMILDFGRPSGKWCLESHREDTMIDAVLDSRHPLTDILGHLSGRRAPRHIIEMLTAMMSDTISADGLRSGSLALVSTLRDSGRQPPALPPVPGPARIHRHSCAYRDPAGKWAVNHGLEPDPTVVQRLHTPPLPPRLSGREERAPA